MRGDRWHELDVRSHGRDDGAAVRYIGPDGRRVGGFGRIGSGPDRAPLTNPKDGRGLRRT